MLDLFLFQDKKAHELSERETLKGETLEQIDKLNSSISKGPHGYICKGLESIWNWSGCADSKNMQVVAGVRYAAEGQGVATNVPIFRTGTGLILGIIYWKASFYFHLNWLKLTKTGFTYRRG